MWYDFFKEVYFLSKMYYCPLPKIKMNSFFHCLHKPANDETSYPFHILNDVKF